MRSCDIAHLTSSMYQLHTLVPSQLLHLFSFTSNRTLPSHTYSTETATCLLLRIPAKLHTSAHMTNDHVHRNLPSCRQVGRHHTRTTSVHAYKYIEHIQVYMHIISHSSSHVIKTLRLPAPNGNPHMLEKYQPQPHRITSHCIASPRIGIRHKPIQGTSCMSRKNTPHSSRTIPIH